MTARVLVVDDILSNVKLLEAKLSAEYFEVASAFNGMDALARIEEHIPDMPEQYYWVHKRFKTRPPGEPGFY